MWRSSHDPSGKHIVNGVLDGILADAAGNVKVEQETSSCAGGLSDPESFASSVLWEMALGTACLDISRASNAAEGSLVDRVGDCSTCAFDHASIGLALA